VQPPVIAYQAMPDEIEEQWPGGALDRILQSVAEGGGIHGVHDGHVFRLDLTPGDQYSFQLNESASYRGHGGQPGLGPVLPGASEHYDSIRQTQFRI
jgi:hypothetical protein